MAARILIVDDEPMVLRIYRMALESEGFIVDDAPNGAVALEKLDIGLPDILVTDIEMPTMDGETLCRRIVERFPDRRFPIIVQTSLTAREHRNWSNDIDNLVFMEKPISVRRLVSEIARLHEVSSQEDTSHG